MIFYFTKMDVFMAPEKTDECRIVFKFHILKLVISWRCRTAWSPYAVA